MNTINDDPRVWIFDLDETLGQFGILCVLVKIYRHFNNEYPSPKYTVDHYLGNDNNSNDSGFRPGLIELMKLGEDLLERNLSDEIVIYTSASNANGWVDYIVECIEYYCNVKKGTINRVISSDVSFVPSRDGCGIKDIKHIIYPKTSLNNVIMVDDKVNNIVQYNNTNANISNIFSVTPYQQFIPPWKFLRNMSCWDINVETRIREKCCKEKQKRGIFNNIDGDDINHPVGLSLLSITHDAKLYPHEIHPVSYRLDNELILIKNELINRFIK